jgi:hypothetical protein
MKFTTKKFKWRTYLHFGIGLAHFLGKKLYATPSHGDEHATPSAACV